MDIQLYLDRIKYRGKVSARKEVLFELQAAHLLNVPFENLDIHYGKKITLDISSIYNKIVIRRRGGFCYELNGLFYHLLQEIGFDVQMISARVYSKDGNYGQEYDHLALIVEVDGTKYLVDVGFGKFSFQPLELLLEVNQRDAFGLFRFDKANEDDWRINLIKDGNLVPQYLFTTIERKFRDFETMCAYHQTSKESHFTSNKVISKITPNGRITLNDTQLKITEGDAEKIIEFEERQFETNLQAYFGIEVSGNYE